MIRWDFVKLAKAMILLLGFFGLGLAVLVRAENVGIGVLDPQAVLHVRGDASGNNDVIFQNLNSHMGSNDTAVVMIIDNADGQRVKTRPLDDLGGDGDWMIASTIDVPTNVAQDIWTTGKVGIGLMEPQVELDILGDMAASGDVYAGGQFIASTYGQASDRRLKTDIEALEDGLALLRELETVKFRYTGTGLPTDENRLHYGVIAQQIQQVDPDLVSAFEPAGGGEEFLAVNTTSVIYLLANALQQLDEQVQSAEGREEALMMENVSLRLQLIDLYQRVEALEAARR